jgi:hypothetical protein
MKTTIKNKLATTTMNQRILILRPPRRLIFTSALHSTVIMDTEITEAGEEEDGEEVVAGVYGYGRWRGGHGIRIATLLNIERLNNML